MVAKTKKIMAAGRKFDDLLEEEGSLFFLLERAMRSHYGRGSVEEVNWCQYTVACIESHGAIQSVFG